MPSSSLPHWLRLQALLWLPLLAAQGSGLFGVPWPVLCGLIALSFLTLCTLLGAVRTPADVVTIVRVAGLLAVGYAASSELPLAAWLSLLGLVLLDLVDGALARRFGGTDAGAVLDMEADQLTVLLLALLVVRGGGAPWVLLAPGIRYVFVLAMWAAGAPAHEPKPVNGDNRRGRICCALVLTALLAALIPAIPPPAAELAAATAVVVLLYSFASDARFLLARLRSREGDAVSWVDWFVVAAYASYVVEITLFPVPSEASTWQLFAPSPGAPGAGADDRLVRAQRRPLWHKLLLFLLPTAVCVALFLVPLLGVFLPDVASALSCRHSLPFAVVGAVLIGLGRFVTFAAMLQLRGAQRAGRRAGGMFVCSRNPGLVGMFAFYLGLCLVFGSWLLWLGLPFYVLNMHFRVRLEEAHLERALGVRWRDYAAAVPRYLGCRSRGEGAAPVAQDEVAAWFDETYRKKGFSYLRPPRAYPIFVQLLRARPGERLLDVACGPGLLLRAALERGVAASGVDISQQAVGLANRYLPEADARCGNAEELPFADESFDCVTCLGSIERFLDRERALREMLRVARPGARFCFLVRNASTLVWRFWREGLGNREVQGHQDARTIEQWRALFTRCGFVVEVVLPDQWPRQRWRQLLPWWRPRPGRDEPVARPIVPLRWCNELVFVLRAAGERA